MSSADSVTSVTTGGAMARVVAVEVCAAHEGVAELMVTLEHANGGRSPVALDGIAARALMDRCQVSEPDDLIGTGWDQVRDAMAVSWDRFSNVGA